MPTRQSVCLRGEPFKKSQNDYDWLGLGIYFREYGADRALRFAHDQKARGKLETPAIVGALIQIHRGLARRAGELCQRFCLDEHVTVGASSFFGASVCARASTAPCSPRVASAHAASSAHARTILLMRRP